MNKHAIQLFLLAALLVPAGAHAQGAGTHDHASHQASAAESMTLGEVRKVDKAAGKVTLKHGAIKNLDMEAMTMLFRVKDPAMLDQLKAGDKVRFTADKIGGAPTLTRVEPAP